MEPDAFREAVDSLHAVRIRPELTVGPIRPPGRLAPYSYALGFEVEHRQAAVVPEHSDGDAFGRLILLHDPAGDDAWSGYMRLVAYIQADVEDTLAADPLLAEVAWSWLTEGLTSRGVEYRALGGTVTATTSVRFGDIAGPPKANQLEVRASWTPDGSDLTEHALAFADMLANVAGLPPEGVRSIR